MYKSNIYIYIYIPHLEKARILLYRLRSIVNFHCQQQMNHYMYFVDFFFR